MARLALAHPYLLVVVAIIALACLEETFVLICKALAKRGLTRWAMVDFAIIARNPIVCALHSATA